MPDKDAEKPAAHVVDEPAAEPKKGDSLAPGDFVTLKGGHPAKGDGPEPVGRVAAVKPVVQLSLDKDGNPALDKHGVAKAEPDGEMLVVTWPRLRIESEHRADELKPAKAPGA